MEIFAIHNLFCLALSLHTTFAATVDSAEEDLLSERFNIEYSRYLNEVSQILEADEGLKKAAGDEATHDQKQLAEHLKYASRDTRSKLDELKRIELARLKTLHKRAMQKKTDEHKEAVQSGRMPDKKELPKTGFDHVDASNPNSFEGEDLRRLITETMSRMSKIDRLRKTDFKHHEMRKAHEYKTKFRDLSPEQQKQKLEEHLEKAKKHPKINHPGGMEQLKEVWEKSDGLAGMDFNPRTFFMMHDIDNDGLLSPSEVEALFERELERLYNLTTVEKDEVEKNEDMNQMREHIFTEVDQDKDGMVSWEEFKNMVDHDSNGDEGWQSVRDGQQFTNEELEKFEADLKIVNEK